MSLHPFSLPLSLSLLAAMTCDLAWWVIPADCIVHGDAAVWDAVTQVLGGAAKMLDHPAPALSDLTDHSDHRLMPRACSRQSGVVLIQLQLRPEPALCNCVLT